jgi:hypothetical protein
MSEGRWMMEEGRWMMEEGRCYRFQDKVIEDKCQ